IQGIDDQTAANTQKIKSLQATLPTAAHQLAATTSALQKASQGNSADHQVVSAQIAEVFDDIAKLAAQLQTQVLQGITQAFFERNLKEDKSNRLMEVNKQQSVTLSSAYVSPTGPQPASAFGNVSALSGDPSRVKLSL